MESTMLKQIALKRILMQLVQQNQQLETSKQIKQNYIISSPNLAKIWEELDTSKITIQQLNVMKVQLQTFCKYLTQSPILWFEALANDKIMSDEQNIRINRPSTITKIYMQIMEQINQQLYPNHKQQNLINTNDNTDKIQKSRTANQQNLQIITNQNSNIISQIIINEQNKQFTLNKQDNISKQERKNKFEKQYIDQSTKSLIAEALNNYANIIATIFIQGKQVLIKQENKIDEQINKCQIMNTYVLFGMLKQMTAFSKQIIAQNVKNSFPQISALKQKQFRQYIQKNYQFLTLYTKFSSHAKILSQEELEKYINAQNDKWLTFIKNCQTDQSVILKKIQSVDGQYGILVVKKIPTVLTKQQMQAKIKKEQRDKQRELKREAKIKQYQKQKSQGKQVVVPVESKQDSNSSEQQQISQKQKQNKNKGSQNKLKFGDAQYPYLILRIQKGNQIRVTHVKTCQKTWKVFEAKMKIDSMYEALKTQLEENNKYKDKDYYSYGVPTVESATIGGNLGKCLADINKYKNANQFLKDLSKATAICSCFSYALTEVPILGYFIIAGGFTYSFYVTLNNKATSRYKKMNQIGGATMTAVGSIGSILGGIFIGQALIPVPILGAFIGGVFGGFYGTKGVRKINNFILKTQFRDIIVYLKQTCANQNHWIYTPQLIQRLGINLKYFEQEGPPEKAQRDIFITAICFCIVTFYESKRYIQRNQRILKQCTTKGNLMKSIDEQVPFDNQFNIVNIIDYLTQEKFILIDNIEKLQKFISHIVD